MKKSSGRLGCLDCRRGVRIDECKQVIRRRQLRTGNGVAAERLALERALSFRPIHEAMSSMITNCPSGLSSRANLMAAWRVRNRPALVPVCSRICHQPFGSIAK